MKIENLPQDFKEFLKYLNKHDVIYLVVGGYAVSYHGYPRFTRYIDIWVEVSKKNALKICKTLKEFGFDLPELKSEMFMKKGRIIRMGIEPMLIEILTSISGLDFSETYKNAIVSQVDNIDIPFISLQDLRINKKASGRTKDLLDLENFPET